MIFLMMGPQACGKGTQAEFLSVEFGIPVITVGQLLRDIPKTSPNYERVQSELNSGVLVDHDIVVAVISERITRKDCKNGYILDGWGRCMEDIQAFDPKPNFVIHINIPREETMRRITGRRICSTDNKTYNIHTMSKDEIAACKGNLVQRADDTEEAVKTRLDIYSNDTMPVVHMFESRGNLLEIDGMGTPKEVFGRILSQLATERSLAAQNH